MGETTLVKADKELVKKSRELGANVKRVVGLALEEFIQRNKPGKESSVEHNGGTLVEAAKTDKIAKQVCHHPSSNLGNPNSSSFSRLGLPSASQPRIS